uniref:Longin domain-containing protein n=1 Tax=Macrostomum lignano TaxID=282301 RepID=A0A1I8FSC1_9PLAT
SYKLALEFRSDDKPSPVQRQGSAGGCAGAGRDYCHRTMLFFEGSCYLITPERLTPAEAFSIAKNYLGNVFTFLKTETTQPFPSLHSAKLFNSSSSYNDHCSRCALSVHWDSSNNPIFTCQSMDLNLPALIEFKQIPSNQRRLATAAVHNLRHAAAVSLVRLQHNVRLLSDQRLLFSVPPFCPACLTGLLCCIPSDNWRRIGACPPGPWVLLAALGVRGHQARCWCASGISFNGRLEESPRLRPLNPGTGASPPRNGAVPAITPARRFSLAHADEFRLMGGGERAPNSAGASSSYAPFLPTVVAISIPAKRNHTRRVRWSRCVFYFGDLAAYDSQEFSSTWRPPALSATRRAELVNDDQLVLLVLAGLIMPQRRPHQHRCGLAVLWRLHPECRTGCTASWLALVALRPPSKHAGTARCCPTPTPVDPRSVCALRPIAAICCAHALYRLGTRLCAITGFLETRSSPSRDLRAPRIPATAARRWSSIPDTSRTRRHHSSGREYFHAVLPWPATCMAMRWPEMEDFPYSSPVLMGLSFHAPARQKSCSGNMSGGVLGALPVPHQSSAEDERLIDRL